MSKMQITFKNPEEIVAFVNTVSRYDFDMDLKKGERFFKKKLNLEYDYFYGRKTVNNNSYYLSMYNIHNYNKQYKNVFHYYLC